MRPGKDADTVLEAERETHVLHQTEVLVVGGGPAGLAAAIAAGRQGAKVILIERYGYVGGMATGGLVLMLDRMGSDEGEQVVRGFAQEVVDRLDEMGATIYPPREAWGSADEEAVNRWRHIGAVGPQSRRVRYSPTVDPEYLKILGARMLEEAGV
ncbi:MAG: FAD-dependent oxidoreductase, partial [Anaerolineae bacterium]|nr:FAD-dependent oxidoreductase [Anaerolineae bacterium]